MTLKQRSAIKKTVENGGNVSKAMRDSGYSKSTSRNPSKLTDSKSWRELLEEKLPEEFLLDCLYVDIYNNPGNRKALLELAFKIKGKFTIYNSVEAQDDKYASYRDLSEKMRRTYDL